MKILRLIQQLVLVGVSLSITNEYNRGVKYEDFLMKKNSQEKVLSIFYSKECTSSWEAFGFIQNGKYFIDNEIDLELINLSESSKFPDFFTSGWHCKAILYIKQ